MRHTSAGLQTLYNSNLSAPGFDPAAYCRQVISRWTERRNNAAQRVGARSKNTFNSGRQVQEYLFFPTMQVAWAFTFAKKYTMIATKGYAAPGANEALQPFSFERRDLWLDSNKTIKNNRFNAEKSSQSVLYPFDPCPPCAILRIWRYGSFNSG